MTALLGIHEFYIQQSLSLFNRSYKLNASLELSHLSIFDKSLLGTFYYEQTIKMKKKIQDSIAYTEALDFYSKQIISDLNFVCSDTTKVEEFGEYHFRRGANAFRKNLYLPIEIFIGLNFFGFDAEVYFSAPEPSQKFERKSRFFRYLKFENRESVAFSGNISLLNYRISESLLLQNKSAFFLGFNKWHDIDEAKRSFEEVFLFQFTARQAVYYNPLDKNGFIFGLGLMEEASYIIYNEPLFHIGLSFSLGYKF